MTVIHPTQGVLENAAERRLKTMDLRKQGFTYAQIGKTLGISSGTAYNDVMVCLRELAKQQGETTTEYRALQIERMENLYDNARSKLLPRKDGIPLSAKDYAHYANIAIKANQELSKLLGLYAPQKFMIAVAEVDRLAQLTGQIAVKYMTPENRAAFLIELKRATTAVLRTQEPCELMPPQLPGPMEPTG